MVHEISPTLKAVLADRKVGYFADKGLTKLNFILILSLLSSYATGYDGSMMNGLQSLDEWKGYFNQPGAHTLALLNAIQNVGQLITIPFAAYSCDQFGRKPVLIGSAFILLIGVILQAAAQNVGMFIGARCILGVGLGFNITAAPLLIIELAFPTHKSQMVSLYNSLWGSGALVAAWTTYGSFRILNTWAWRLPSILQALSSIIQICLFWFVIESPRWLISKERYDEARDIIIKYHANGNPDDPIVDYEMQEIRAAIQIDLEQQQNNSYLAFFHTTGNRRRFFIILAVGFFSQWSGNGIISYYLSLVLDSIGYTSQDTQTLINAILTIYGLVIGIIFAFLCDFWPRRTLFLFSTAGALASYIVWTGLEATYEKQTGLDGVGNAGIAKGVLAIIFIYNFFMAVGWGPLQVTYVVEILPFHLRARGLVLYNFFVDLALIFNQYANPVALTNIKWKYYIVYDVWLFVECLVVYFLFVETRGASLEEVSFIIDGGSIQEELLEHTSRHLEKDPVSPAVVIEKGESGEDIKTS
ncbi:hypothetical protein BP5796_12555 [Coleophoma crateriformis]|uniref:Major facilitator superfamily (MFS) profile domain-containing protein n=1 Tax=Coleophoma crateriformis TaxID=565419 RepID=A0A3D8Q8J1_9HELO|nr:hypothetical protein BP5796_12555 [Coleophoma crateriformis]